MERKPCAACHRLFWPRAQNPGQLYCSDPECQRARRRQWQKSKRQNDPDYLENQAKAQRSWAKRNPDYWRRYRERHPEYVARNRAQQTLRNAHQQTTTIAKMGALPSRLPFLSGIYRLSAWAGGVAKMDSWIVKISFVSDDKLSTAQLQRDDSMGTSGSR